MSRLTDVEVRCECGMNVVLHRHDGKGIAWEVYVDGSDSDLWLNGPADPAVPPEELAAQLVMWNQRVDAFKQTIQCECGQRYGNAGGHIVAIE